MRKLFAVFALFQVATFTPAQTLPKRTIDRCAQDGAWFYAWDSKTTGVPVSVERDGISIRVEHPTPKSADAIVSLSHGSHVIVQKQKDFDQSYGWLTVSQNHAFALTWNFSASATSTQLFSLSQRGNIIEDIQLIPLAEQTFIADAKRSCPNPGLNTTAIKWLDPDHLLLSVNAWTSGFCESNFTEGFILDIPSRSIQRKLSERELIDFPAVCTWNVVPVPKH
jgi:hypothetical protein